MRYDRRNISSAVNAAIQTRTRFVYATAYGLVVTDTPPPAGQAHYEIVQERAILRRQPIAYTRADIIYRLREKRNAIVDAWGQAAEANDPSAHDPTTGSKLDRMWRLTAAIDAAIVRQGGEV